MLNQWRIAILIGKKMQTINSIQITGKLSHDSNLGWVIKSKRHSGIIDTLRLDVDTNLMDLIDKAFCNIKGTIVTKPYYSDDGKKHLAIFIQPNEILYSNDSYDGNFACVSGEIVRDVVLRQTPAGKIISDFLVKINNQSDCALPCIAWGSVAELVNAMDKNAFVKVFGRLQSREYQKLIDNKYVTKIAYELCVHKVLQEN